MTTMLTQSQTLTTQVDVKSLEALLPPEPFRYLVTLINPFTTQEVAIEISVLSDSTAEVLREIAHQRVMQNLKGFVQIHELLPLNSPVPF